MSETIKVNLDGNGFRAVVIKHVAMNNSLLFDIHGDGKDIPNNLTVEQARKVYEAIGAFLDKQPDAPYETETKKSHNPVVDTLVEVARRAGMDNKSNHPVDIAVAMMNAIEYGAETIVVLKDNGVM